MRDHFGICAVPSIYSAKPSSLPQGNEEAVATDKLVQFVDIACYCFKTPVLKYFDCVKFFNFFYELSNSFAS